MLKKWLVGRAGIVAAVIAILLTLYHARFDLFEQLEFKLIDAKFRLRGPLRPGCEVAIIDIDKRSILEIGKWPWSRRTVARLIRILSQKGARVIGLDFYFSSADPDAGADQELAKAVKESGRVVIGYFFSFAPEESTFQSRGEFRQSLRELSRYKIPVHTNISGREFTPDIFEALGAEPNIPIINRAAAGSGFYNVYLERDGSVRSAPCVVRAGGDCYPCFGVAVIKQYTRAKNIGLVSMGKDALALHVGEMTIPTDARGQIFLNYYGPKRTFASYSAAELLSEAVPDTAVRDRIVLVGGSSIGDFEMRITPFSAAMASVELQATSIDNMIHHRYLTESPDSVFITIVCIIVFPLLLGFSLPRAGKTVRGFAMAVVCILLFVNLNLYLFTARNVQANMLYPLLSVVLSYLGVSMQSGILHERSAARLKRTVAGMGRAISSVLDIDDLLPKILTSVMQAVDADRGMLITCGEDGQQPAALKVECQKNFSRAAITDDGFAYGREIIARVRDTKKSVVMGAVKGEGMWHGLRRRKDHSPRSIYCLPLRHRDVALEIIYMEGDASKNNFRNDDVKIIDSFGAQAAIAIENAQMYSRLRKAEEKLRDENIYLKQEIEETRCSEHVVGKSKVIEECLNLARKASTSDITVLIEGETGTGKELIARAIHLMGTRKNALFIAQNCSALPESLLESELFGHKKGAFTGAVQDKKGLFEIADGGTIFLDEVADMTPALQAKLLRVAQEGIIRPVGGVEEKTISLRVVSATNRSLAEEVKAGRFREDLYYRLNAFTIKVPPLRERKEDIPILAMHFLERLAKRLNKTIKGISQDAMMKLLAYDFPGNVRELENEIEKAAVMVSDGEMIRSGDLSVKIVGATGTTPHGVAQPGQLRLEDAQRKCILAALARCGGHKTKAARELGISRRGLYFMIKRLKLDVQPHQKYGSSDAT
jgi:Nif-specific regulatory protein